MSIEKGTKIAIMGTPIKFKKNKFSLTEFIYNKAFRGISNEKCWKCV